MHWYQWFSLITLCICMGSCLVHFIHLIRLGKPVDYSHKMESVPNAVKFSFTGAMSPAKKESAFLSVFLYIILLFGVPIPADIRYVLAGILMLFLPVGKLRHAIYFFAARYHLGFFFGWRNVWPPKSIQ